VVRSRGFTLIELLMVIVVIGIQAGWSATSSSVTTPRQCSLFVGNATPVGVATTEGLVACA